MVCWSLIGYPDGALCWLPRFPCSRNLELSSLSIDERHEFLSAYKTLAFSNVQTEYAPELSA
jgi:hypothetical protein